MEICYQPIGILHCGLYESEKAPKFYTESQVGGVIEIHDQYAQGLSGIEDYRYIIVLFHFHKSKGGSLRQRRRGIGELRGVFSLCSPVRPNPIGMSVLRLERVEGNMLHVNNVDMLDGTPILDIKPYKPQDYPGGSGE